MPPAPAWACRSRDIDCHRTLSTTHSSVGTVPSVNLEHRELLASDDWRQTLQKLALPFALGDRSYTDLGDDVLELGPGPGLTTDLLRVQCPRLTAVELDADMAEALRKRLIGANVDVVHADATAMPFESERFTGAASFTMLHHVPTAERQDQVLGEVLRVLRPGGLLLLNDSMASDDLAAFHVDDVYCPVDPDGLADRLIAVGFVDVEVRTNPFAWACHARRPA
jgi:SAM-dependent methyltransferase